MTAWLDKIPSKYRRALIVLADLCSIGLSLYLAFYLRFEGNIPAARLELMPKLFLIHASLRIAFLVGYGLYRGFWRYAGIEDLIRIFRAVSLSSMASVVSIWLIYDFADLPRSIFVIDWSLTIMLIGGARFSVRALRAISPPFKNQNCKRVLIVGADDTAESLLRSILFKPKDYCVVGLVSDNPAKQKMHIHGVPILGARHELAALVAKHRIHEIFIALPFASASVFREIVTQCQSANVRIRRVPAVKDILNGQLTINHLREVQLEDLLGRMPVSLNNENVAAFLQDKVVMVTGAGGSIGSELCRQIAHFRPRLLVMLDHAENGLYHLEQDMRQRKMEAARVLAIADVTDASRMQEVFGKHRPEIIFHAAAHKHVPLMEMNKKEAVKNNVLGTRVLAETACRFGAEKLVMISTDKAVNPTSAMGASKRLCEMLLQSMSRRSTTAFITVRFGNVLGSDGSVVPLFKEQILKGGPVTVTHADIERYFMTIPEAVQLVLQAATLGKGGEIFILDMGQPIKIVDLARNLITLSGYRPQDIGIQFTGLRPGEKMYEELWSSEENAQPTVYDKILMAQAKTPLHELNGEVDELIKLVNDGTEEEMTQLLRRLVPNYQSA
jgi:FlaA1/EpsC-like NDP-sugar epimerase